MASSPGFGSRTLSYKRAINTRFPYASVPEGLRQESTRTRWCLLQKVRRHCEKRSSDFLLANGFRFYFTGITSLLFTFPSRYLFTIGEIEYLALASSLACFPQGFLPRAVLKKNNKEHKVIFAYWTITIFGTSFQSVSANQTLPKYSPSGLFQCTRNTPDVISLQPPTSKDIRFGLLPVRSPLLRECF